MGQGNWFKIFSLSCCLCFALFTVTGCKEEKPPNQNQRRGAYVDALNAAKSEKAGIEKELSRLNTLVAERLALHAPEQGVLNQQFERERSAIEAEIAALQKQMTDLLQQDARPLEAIEKELVANIVQSRKDLVRNRASLVQAKKNLANKRQNMVLNARRALVDTSVSVKMSDPLCWQLVNHSPHVISSVTLELFYQGKSLNAAGIASSNIMTSPQSLGTVTPRTSAVDNAAGRDAEVGIAPGRSWPSTPSCMTLRPNAQNMLRSFAGNNADLSRGWRVKATDARFADPKSRSWNGALSAYSWRPYSDNILFAATLKAVEQSEEARNVKKLQDAVAAGETLNPARLAQEIYERNQAARTELENIRSKLQELGKKYTDLKPQEISDDIILSSRAKIAEIKIDVTALQDKISRYQAEIDFLDGKRGLAVPAPPPPPAVVPTTRETEPLNSQACFRMIQGQLVNHKEAQIISSQPHEIDLTMADSNAQQKLESIGLTRKWIHLLISGRDGNGLSFNLGVACWRDAVGSLATSRDNDLIAQAQAVSR